MLAKPLSRNRGQGKENEVKRKHWRRSRQDKGHRQRKLEETLIPYVLNYATGLCRSELFEVFASVLTSVPLKLRPYGAIEICLLLLFYLGSYLLLLYGAAKHNLAPYCCSAVSATQGVQPANGNLVHK